MQKLLMIPSSLLLLLLLYHSWHYRGRKATLTFFGLCFLFGVLRGNAIYQIITNLLGGSSLPYLMVRPVVKIWHASIQECVGWIFALYLSWSTAEWLLTRGGGGKVPLFRLIGLSALLMGSVAYGVEAAAAAVKWWVWTIPIRNPFYSDVPFAGIIAWISTAVDFLGVFLLLYYGGFRSRWKWMLVLLFPLHMVLHMRVENMSFLAPLNPAELWHWLMLCAIFAGIAVGGPVVATRLAPEVRGPDKPLARYSVFITLAGFLLVLVLVQLVLVRDPYLWISLVPFITILLFIRPLAAAAFCLPACLLYGLAVGEWGLVLVPLAVFGVFATALPPLAGRIPDAWRGRGAAAILLLASIALYWMYHERALRYRAFNEISEALLKTKTSEEADALVARMPDPPRPGDSFHLNLLGARLNKRGNYAAARGVLERGLACDSSYSYLWINLGWTYAQLSLYSQAVTAYEKALSLDPVDNSSYIYLGQIYEGLGRDQDAEALYRRGLSYKPGETGITLSLESLLYRQKRFDEAVDLLRKCLPAGGDSGKLAARLAADLFKMGRGDEAIQSYQAVITDGVKQISASALSLALIYWQDKNDLPNALRYARLAAAVDPGPDAFTLKGGILEALGKTDEAHEAYRQAAEAQAAREAAPGRPK